MRGPQFAALTACLLLYIAATLQASGAPVGRDSTTRVQAFGNCTLPASKPLQYLSDLHSDLLTDSLQGWGSLGLNSAAIPPDGRPPTPLKCGPRTYEKGLGHHAPGSIALSLGGQYLRFQCEAAVQWQGGGRGSVVFQVFADDVMRFECGPLSDSDEPRAICVDVSGVNRLRLVALDAGDGYGCDMANWLSARAVADPRRPTFGKAEIVWGAQRLEQLELGSCTNGFSLASGPEGLPQVAVLGEKGDFTASVNRDNPVAMAKSFRPGAGAFAIEADVSLLTGEQARVSISSPEVSTAFDLTTSQPRRIRLDVLPGHFAPGVCASLTFLTEAPDEATVSVRWRNIKCHYENAATPLRVSPRHRAEPLEPPPDSPRLTSGIERELLEWDWRLQDGIGAPREPRSFADALDRVMPIGHALLRNLKARRLDFSRETAQWKALQREFRALKAQGASADDPEWEHLWVRVHRLKRRIALSSPLFPREPILFAKRAPGCFSHQLTQYYGRYALPGGGLYVLDQPGESLNARPLTPPGSLPAGSAMQPELSWDADRLLFAFCEAPTAPEDRIQGCHGRYYHLYETTLEQSDAGLQASPPSQITDGPYDDFSPCLLPNGRIAFVSTRRGGWHRCGSPGCETYTLALAENDGSNPRPISFHETNEWDPSVLNTGNLIYTRWDYVDRNAVFYQQLWTSRPDGSGVASYYGNQTLNPLGIWEARQAPGSDLVMATAGAHHAMTAGSIILVDVARGVNGPAPIVRLTPDTPFPESEASVPSSRGGGWYSPTGAQPSGQPSEEARRWPGHCYRSPWPLSRDCFLAAFSYDSLIGEPTGNRANMFGLYLVDSAGSRELLHRDPNIASLWPIPLRPRPRPPVAPTQLAPEMEEGTLFLQNVRDSEPALPEEPIRALRIVQVLPKSTPGANSPMVGLPNIACGRQVLGTVPVEEDGSACFRVPARRLIAFQALDGKGRAVQVMRSGVYLQPGESLSCSGCHEPRHGAPPVANSAAALRREPSAIRPGPDGSRPLSYPLLVQPVLDRHCVRCHSGDTPSGKVDLTGAVEGAYTRSYNALAPRVPWSAWQGGDGFREANCEPLSRPCFFGARGSALMDMLLKGHHKVVLTPGDIERLATWMDSNVLFYGTFDRSEQARQLAGERIAEPSLQ